MTLLLDPPAPVSERWRIRPDDARVELSGRASRFAPVFRGRFTSVAGTVRPDAVDVDVDVTSLTTGRRAYDELLAAADPFEAARHPVAAFRSEQVRWAGGRAVVDGHLVLRGRSAPVRLLATRTDVSDGVARLCASGRVDRRAYGLRLDLPGCRALVPSQLDLSIEVTAVRDQAPGR